MGKSIHVWIAIIISVLPILGLNHPDTFIVFVLKSSWMSQENSKWLVSGYNPNILHLKAGYNPLTNHLLTSWDIQAERCHNLLVFETIRFRRPLVHRETSTMVSTRVALGTSSSDKAGSSIEKWPVVGGFL